jgi:cytidylate kinase
MTNKASHPQHCHIAIDGPVAGGKGTVAKELAVLLGIPCLDTGAIYRGIGVSSFQFAKTEDKIQDFIKQIPNVKISAKIIDNVTHIYINEKDITSQLRENEVSRRASICATYPEVRALCTRISQELAKNQSLIAEGRDICSVVLPNAKYKFYLDADIKVRARRRHEELLKKGKDISFATVLAETKARDESDMTKGGLKRTADAIFIDSSKLSVDETTKEVLKYISR